MAGKVEKLRNTTESFADLTGIMANRAKEENDNLSLRGVYDKSAKFLKSFIPAKSLDRESVETGNPSNAESKYDQPNAELTVQSLFNPAINSDCKIYISCNDAQKINTYLQAILTIVETITTTGSIGRIAKDLVKTQELVLARLSDTHASLFKQLVSTDLLPVISVYYKDNNSKYARGTIKKINFITSNITISPTKSKFSSNQVEDYISSLDNLCIKSDERIAIIFGKVMTTRGHQRDIKKHDSCQLKTEEKSQ